MALLTHVLTMQLNYPKKYTIDKWEPNIQASVCNVVLKSDVIVFSKVRRLILFHVVYNANMWSTAFHRHADMIPCQLDSCDGMQSLNNSDYLNGRNGQYVTNMVTTQ